MSSCLKCLAVATFKGFEVFHMCKNGQERGFAVFADIEDEYLEDPTTGGVAGGPGPSQVAGLSAAVEAAAAAVAAAVAAGAQAAAVQAGMVGGVAGAGLEPVEGAG